MVTDVYFPRVNGGSTLIRTFRSDLVAAGHRCVPVAPAYPASHAEVGGAMIRIHSPAASACRSMP